MALTLSHFRFGEASGTESTHPWLAAEDRGIMLPPGRPILARATVQADATGQANCVMQWQRRLLRAGAVVSDWADVTTTSSVVRTGATAVFANGANCTKRLSGTGTFEATAAGCTHDGSAGGAANDIAANGNSETLIGIQIIGADTAIGDDIELRITRGGVTLLNAYAVVPTIRVGVEILAAQSRDASLHTSISAPVNKISGTQVNVECAGMSDADLGDDTLTIAMNVWGTTVVGSTDPADYTVHLYGPDVWSGGSVATKGKYLGMAIPPGFTFAQDIPEGVRRVLATFAPSRTVTFGADASLLETA
jgi:hypothetical protein